MQVIKAIFVSALLLSGLMSAPAAQAEDTLAVGTGSKDSAYYPLGRAICILINRKVNDMSCEVLAAEDGDAPASIANLINVQNGSVEIGVSRSDWQHYAIKKTGPGPFRFMHTNFDNLRSLFSVYSEPLTILAKHNAGIQNLDGLKGKRVNIGGLKSSPRDAMEMVMAAKGWTTKTFALAEQLPTRQQSLAFCNNLVQAIVFMRSHPDPYIEQTARLCHGRMVNISGPEIKKLVADKPYLIPETVPSGLYTGTTTNIETFGVAITVISTSDVADETIYRVVKGVFENLSMFKKMHPALKYIVPDQMSKVGLSAPLHPGAEQYFRERGLM